MKIVLAGAYGNLGSDIFRSLLAAGLRWLLRI